MWTKFLLCLGFVLLWLLLAMCGTAKAEMRQMDVHMYWMHTTSEATVGWEANNEIDMYLYFELRVEWMETGQQYAVVETQNLEHTFRFPRVGHFVVLVRACRRQADGSDTLFSEWARSDNVEYARVDGSPRAWVVYCLLPPPGTPNITERRNENGYTSASYKLGPISGPRCGWVSRLLGSGRRSFGLPV